MRPFAGDDELLPCGPMRCRFIAFFTLTLYFTGSALAGIVTGNVTGVLDGDTIEVLNGHHADRIRLSGIDCPENGQAYSKKAKQAASALVFGKKSHSKLTARTSTGGPLPMSFCQTARTSTMNSSGKAGAGGIGSMRRGIRCWKV